MQIYTWLPIFISVMALVISAVSLYWSIRPESPLIVARIIKHDGISQDPNIQRRVLLLRQETDPSLWLVRTVCTSRPREKWFLRMGKEKRNDYGEFEGFWQDSDWQNRILFDPPRKDVSVILHPDAPSTLQLSCYVVRCNRRSFARKVWVIPEQ